MQTQQVDPVRAQATQAVDEVECVAPVVFEIVLVFVMARTL
ncbi:hypothetical protein ACF063_08865 [Streptomyces chartreusis]